MIEWRPVRFAADVFTDLKLRTWDGRALVVTWGEPDQDGFYELTFTAVDDGFISGLIAAFEASIQDLGLGTDERVERARLRLIAALREHDR